MTVVFVFIGCLIAPQLINPKLQGIFHYIQDFQGYISPGILAAFIFGLFVKRAPSVVWLGLAIIMATIILYIIFW